VIRVIEHTRFQRRWFDTMTIAMGQDRVLRLEGEDHTEPDRALQVLCQHVFHQEMPGPKEMGLDCANGQREDVSHLFIRHLLKVVQDQDNAILRRQFLLLFAHDCLPGA